MTAYRLKLARLTDASGGDTIDTAIGEVETATAGLLGVPLDTDVTVPYDASAGHNHASLYAPVANGVSGGGTHAHSGVTGDGGGQIDHIELKSIGTNTHAQLDTFVALATATPTANAIVKADSGGKVDGWVTDAATTAKGKVQLATDGETAAGKAVQGNDSRLGATPVNLAISSALTTGQASGVRDTGTAGETLAFGDVVYLKAADSRFWKAKADATATSGPVRLALVIVGGAAGATVTLLGLGYLCLAGWNWTVGAPIYLSPATAGLLTQTAPATAGQVVRIVGYGQAATIAHICIDSTYIVRS